MEREPPTEYKKGDQPSESGRGGSAGSRRNAAALSSVSKLELKSGSCVDAAAFPPVLVMRLSSVVNHDVGVLFVSEFVLCALFLHQYDCKQCDFSKLVDAE